MARVLIAAVLALGLQGCSTARPVSTSDSACASQPASYACQIEAYQRAP